MVIWTLRVAWLLALFAVGSIGDPWQAVVVLVVWLALGLGLHLAGDGIFGTR